MAWGVAKKLRHPREVAALAAAQYGAVSHAQLVEIGLSPWQIHREIDEGRLHTIHRGVYGVGHPALQRHGMCIAAVLACGDGALLSHWSAAWLWGLSDRFPSPPHVTTPIRGHRRATVRLHHSTILEDDDRGECDGIAVTRLPRTLLDISTGATDRRIETAAERAERMGILDTAEIEALLRRSGGHKGRGRLERALAIYRTPAFVRSRAERLFLALVADAGLPIPAMNINVAGYEIDAYWEDHLFAVEIDGFEFHRTRVAFERDPLRVEDLKLAGIDCIRITARRIEREPDQVAARLRIHLQRRERGRS